MKTANLTGVLIQDPVSGNFTSFFEEMPEIIAQGKNEQEAIDNLMEAFQIIMEYKQAESRAQVCFPMSHVTTRNFQLQLA